MTDRTRRTVQALAAALFFVNGAVSATPVAAANDPSMARLHAPCRTALADEQKASRRLKSGTTSPDDARKALDDVAAGLNWNEKACGAIAGRTSAQNDVRGEMYLVNKAFLLSLKGEAEQVLGRPAAARSFAQARPLLQRCMTWSKIPQDVHRSCATQIANNDSTQRPVTSTPDPTDPCYVAVAAANDTGTLLKAKDTASFEQAYRRASDGLAANATCRSHPQMQLVNDAYLRSYKIIADRNLNIPLSADPDIANAAAPFTAANAELTTCAGWAGSVPDNAASNCRLLLASNNDFAKTYAEQDARSAAPALPTLAWPYAIRSTFVWDAPGSNSERQVFADEEVRGAGGWSPAARGQEMRLADRGDWVLFAAIRNWEDLHTMFDFPAGGEPVGRDFFRTKMLLVAVQRKPNQQCDIRVNSVNQIAREANVTPAVRVDYTLVCQPPGTAANTIVKVIPADKTNGQVSFVEDGGTGPSGVTPPVAR